jgi:phage gp16-like protein
MTDEHRGLPHDLPEYTPNWPVAVKVKAKVVRGRAGWIWAHNCPRRILWAMAFGYPTQPEAFAAALKHARGCW